MGKVEITDFNLTGRERDILSILWNSEKSLIASEVVTYREDLTINTVQAVLKKLLKRNLIEVDQIVYSGTVLSRSYKPTLTEAEFQTRMISANILDLKRFGISPAQFVLGFLGNSKTKMTDSEADELLAMIQARRKKG
ncbi:MAG: BlaI/MecI/CopY family transcriptional regulator [Lachnospiraceae bacterium]|nr:BlaI/MecI/CopY family transcriptional regulator [Lachnospiraceae bacterium]